MTAPREGEALPCECDQIARDADGASGGQIEWAEAHRATHGHYIGCPAFRRAAPVVPDAERATTEEERIAPEFATVANALLALDKLWRYAEGFTLGRHGPEQSADGWYAFEQAEATIRQVLAALRSPAPAGKEWDRCPRHRISYESVRCPMCNLADTASPAGKEPEGEPPTPFGGPDATDAELCAEGARRLLDFCRGPTEPCPTCQRAAAAIMRLSRHAARRPAAPEGE